MTHPEGSAPKPCPFCGVPPTWWPIKGDPYRLVCGNPGCAMNGLRGSMSEKDWNTRAVSPPVASTTEGEPRDEAAAILRRVAKELADKLRCETSGNQCGTDTWRVGWTCPCVACQTWLSLFAAAAPSHRLSAAGRDEALATAIRDVIATTQLMLDDHTDETVASAQRAAAVLDALLEQYPKLAAGSHQTPNVKGG